ncbi:MAG: MBL fold metallo-hydrolase [Caulobacteraceae bacterium]|nr:MBL fold metallo-hydrolase [Caulobacteraceae bacterium]
MPEVLAFFHSPTNTVTYLVWEGETKKAVVIDPVLDFDSASGKIATDSVHRVLTAARDRGLKLEWVLETHAHADHLSAADHIRKLTGVPVAIGSGILDVQKTFAPILGVDDVRPGGTDFDRLLGDGETLSLGKLTITVIHTPGHTPACVSYRIGDAVFVGDTLFMPDFGTARSDFPGGDARTLYRSIRKLLDLPPETRVYVGHDYLPKDGRREFAWTTTIGAEREGNIHVGGGKDEATFVAMRQARDATLPAPALLLPALQVNIRAGALPVADREGRRFLKLPLNPPL